MDRAEIKNLILDNYTLGDVLDMYVSKLTVKDVEDLIGEDLALESSNLDPEE